jgi:hypothetical protein
MTSRFCSFLTLLLLGQFVFAQPIPKNAGMIAVLNSESFNKKIDFEKLFKKQIFQDFDSELGKILPGINSFNDLFFNQSKETGVTFFPNLVAWAIYNENHKASIFGVVVRVNDEGKLEQKLISEIKQNSEIVNKGGYKTMRNGEAIVSWNSKYFLFLAQKMSESTPTSKPEVEPESSDSLDYVEELNKAVEDIEKKEAKKLALLLSMDSLCDGLFKGSDNFDNVDYQEFLKKKFDVGVWLDGNEIKKFTTGQNQSLNMMLNMPSLNNLSKINDNTYSHIFLNFENGEILLQSEQTINPDFKPLYTALFASKTPSQNLSLIDGSKLLGIGNISFDIYQIAKDVYRESLELIRASLGEAKSEEQKEVNNIILDEKRLFGLLGKDVTVAVMDFVSSQKTYSEFEYNDKDEMVEVKKTKTVQNPIVTTVIGLGNQADMLKLMNYLVKQNVLVKDKKTGFYSAPKSNSQQGFSPDEFKIAVLPKQLVISNDKALIKTKFKSGKPLSPNLFQSITQKNTITFYFDFAKILEIVKKGDLTAKQAQQVDLVKQFIVNLQIQSWFTEANSKAENQIKIEFKDKAINSFEQLINLANELYLRK